MGIDADLKDETTDIHIDIVDNKKVCVRVFAFVVLSLLLAFLFSMATVKESPPKDDWRAGGSTVHFEVLTEMPSDYEGLSEERAKDMAIEHLRSIGNGSITPFGKEDHVSRLVLYHKLGHIICWQFSDSQVNVTINAQTGEMIRYKTPKESEGGNATSDSIQATAIEIIEDWGGIPNDAVGPNVTLLTFTALCSMWHEWEVQWVRLRDGIETTDGIYMRFALDGTLLFYYRSWNMDLEGLNMEFLMSREKAIKIASKYDDDWGNLSSCRLLIRQQGGCGTSSGELYGTRPTCVWVMYFTHDDNRYTRRISVHARTGEIVELNL